MTAYLWRVSQRKGGRWHAQKPDDPGRTMCGRKNTMTSLQPSLSYQPELSCPACVRAVEIASQPPVTKPCACGCGQKLIRGTEGQKTWNSRTYFSRECAIRMHAQRWNKGPQQAWTKGRWHDA